MARLCKEMLEEFYPLRGLWEYSEVGAFGPNDSAREALALVNEGVSPLSHGEKIVLRVAFDLYNGTGGAKIYDVLNSLQAETVQVIGEIFKKAFESRTENLNKG